MEDHIINKNDQYKYILLRGFYYNFFEEEKGGGNREGLDRYPYLKHLIKLWRGNCVKEMAKNNEAVGMKNCLTMGGQGN